MLRDSGQEYLMITTPILAIQAQLTDGCRVHTRRLMLPLQTPVHQGRGTYPGV